MAVRASRTSSSLNGLMIAITIFMGPIPAWARPRHDRAFSTEVHHAERFTTRAQPEPIESNAVPDGGISLTVYERGRFPALPEMFAPAIFGRAQRLAKPDQNVGMTGRRHNRAHAEGNQAVIGTQKTTAAPRRAGKCPALPAPAAARPAMARRRRPP